MPRPILTAAVAIAICGSHAAAQASPYIPLDDPRLPALEHLIALGEIEDPSPMVRPFRRIDAVRALAKVDSTGTARDSTMIRELLDAFADPGTRRAGRWSRAREVRPTAMRDGTWSILPVRTESSLTSSWD